MNVLMVGVDKSIVGGMFTVVRNYINSNEFSEKTNLIYIPTVINGSSTKKILFFLKALYKITRTIVSKHIDIIHGHMSERASVFRGGIIILLGKIFKCKTIIHLHGATFKEWYQRQNYIIQKIIRLIFNRADKILVLGEIWKSSVEKIVKDKEKIEVLYNAVNIPKKNLYNNSATDIIFLGVLIERKGIDDLLNSIIEIKERLPHYVKIKLYGADVCGNIEEKLKELNLGEKVQYAGWLNSNNREECFEKAILNILPSYNEGLPMSILETMSYGIPNISTNIAAIPEAIDDGVNGILVKPGDKCEISKAILQIVENEGLRKIYSINAYEKVKDKFDIRKHLQKVYSIYSDLIQDQ